MKIYLKNEVLSVAVDTYGGELQSLKRNDTPVEYLWQGDPDTYNSKAINIFPYIARLTEGKYTLDGCTYHMQPHGFIPETQLAYRQISEDNVIFEYTATADSMKVYPRNFVYSLEYKLKKNAIEITYKVENKDEKTMYFGIGGHPGFMVPLEEGLGFEDYYLEFAEVKQPYRIGMSEDCFVTGVDTRWELEDGKIQKLTHTMFDDDAIILRDMGRKVTLKSDTGARAVTVVYPDMDYLGIWHWPKSEVPYVCIEPWSSLPSRKNTVEAFETQDNLVQLESGKTYTNKWEIILD
jgi:Galactose mutarotase and related enzymes